MPAKDSSIYLLLSLKQAVVGIYQVLLFSLLPLPPFLGTSGFLVADSFEKKQHFL